MNELPVIVAVGLMAYGFVMGWMCRGAFCDQYGDPGTFHRITRWPRSAARRVRAAPGRLLDWSWGLFDRTGPERAIRAEIEDWQRPAAAVLDRLEGRPVRWIR